MSFVHEGEVTNLNDISVRLQAAKRQNVIVTVQLLHR